MRSTTSASLIYSSLFLPGLRKPLAVTTTRQGRISASARPSGEYSGNGRIVDENLIVLRKRIRETKMMECNYEPPANWMDWEKKYYTTYDSIICEALGLLQTKLMDTRPSYVLATALVMALSVPTSLTLLLLRLLDPL